MPLLLARRTRTPAVPSEAAEGTENVKFWVLFVRPVAMITLLTTSSPASVSRPLRLKSIQTLT